MTMTTTSKPTTADEPLTSDTYLETYRGLLEELDARHRATTQRGEVTVHGRAADAIRRMAEKVARREVEREPAIASCPSCGPGTYCEAMDVVESDDGIEGDDGVQCIGCGKCGMTGPLAMARRGAIEAWNRLPR